MTKTGNLTMMNPRRFHWVGWAIAALLFCLPCTAFAFTATAQVDQTRITPQDVVSLQVIVDGGEADVDTSSISGFQVNPAGTQSSRSYINGTWSHKVIYRYMLIPLKSGVLMIPPITCVRDGESVLTREIKILVEASSARVDDRKGDYFAEASLSSDNIVPGQQAVYTLKLCVAKRIKGASFDPPGFKGLTAKQVADWTKYTRTINGRTFIVNETKYLVQADTPGQFTISPAIFVAQVPVQRTRQRDPFNSMFNDSFFRDSFFDATPAKQVRVVSNPVELTVSSLPQYSGNQPFSGLVGNFSISSELDKNTVKTGESVTLTVMIKGTGNVMDAAMPALNLDTGKFKVYTDTPVQDVQVTELGFEGYKVFKQALVASVPGKEVIPGLYLVFFDTDSKTYKTVTTTPLTLDIQPGGDVSVVDKGPAANGGTGTSVPATPKIKKTEVKLQNRDILDIKEDIAGIHSHPSLSMTWFVVLVCLPALGFGAASTAMRLGAREKSLKEQYREKAWASLKKVRKISPDASGFLPGLSSALTYAVLARGAKGGESLTRDEARQILAQSGRDQDTVNQVTQLMDTMDAARFGGKTMDEKTAQRCLAQVSSLIRTLTIVVCVGISLLVSSGTGMAGQDIKNTENIIDTTVPKEVHPAKDKAGVFVDAVRAYKAGDYAAAAVQFESIAKTQVNNPDLFYNTGNAYLKARDLGRAVLWYERAKKLAPADPDLKFNLAYAQSLLKDKKEVRFSFSDILYFWQGLVSLKWLQYASIALSFCFFIWATSQKIRGRQIFSGIGIFICLVFAGTTLAAGLEYNRIHSNETAVIIAEQADIRSGTMENATLLFDLHAGTQVRVLKKKTNYIKIRFAKDKVGWVARKDAEII
ncbi:BatD family protein [uncultured Desulfobacter sp.]|uniref:BatD family protein n=1 Tax=uncultured Desulfobacter sp. TaxID=240139 RepID=UPI002AA92AF2|nr:BatD family protein [uncultured Desulfobacter sp.]